MKLVVIDNKMVQSCGLYDLVIVLSTYAKGLVSLINSRNHELKM